MDSESNWQNTKSLLLPSHIVRVCRRERAGSHFTCDELGQRATQWGINTTQNHQHSKPQPRAAYEFEETDTQLIRPKCILLFYICSTFGPWIFCHGEVHVHHGNVTAQARAPLVPKLALMVLTHRFVYTKSDWHCRTPGNLPTPLGNKEALLILHKHI